MTQAQVSTFVGGGDVHANGIRQHYLRYGGRGAHGDPDSGDYQSGCDMGLCRESGLAGGFDTYVLDVRGRGLSQHRRGARLQARRQAADVIAFAEALRLDDYALVGHSMGARMSAGDPCDPQFALMLTVLVDPPVSGPGRRPYPSTLPWYVDSISVG